MEKHIFIIDSFSKAFVNTSITFENIIIRRNSFNVITGKTGCGKTTLLNLLGLMDNITKKDKGDVIFNPDHRNNYNYSNLNANKSKHIRLNYFGFLFQQDHLFDDMTGWENVSLPYLVKNPKAKRKEAIEKCKVLIKQYSFHDLLEDNFMQRSPATYSGGQRHRVALLRSLIHDPEVIFADEPLASVDRNTALQILRLLDKQVQDGKTIVMIMHDTMTPLLQNNDIHLNMDKVNIIELSQFVKKNTKEKQ